MKYAGKCYDLAEDFLIEVLPPEKRGLLMHDLAHLLARKIQIVIDEYMADVENALPDVESLL